MLIKVVDLYAGLFQEDPTLSSLPLFILNGYAVFQCNSEKLQLEKSSVCVRDYMLNVIKDFP